MGKIRTSIPSRISNWYARNTPEIIAIIILKYEQGSFGFSYTTLHLKHEEGMANCVDCDQTAPSLIWVYTVCSCLPLPKLLPQLKIGRSLSLYENDFSQVAPLAYSLRNDVNLTTKLHDVLYNHCTLNSPENFLLLSYSLVRYR